jgi:hypothetical protein
MLALAGGFRRRRLVHPARLDIWAPRAISSRCSATTGHSERIVLSRVGGPKKCNPHGLCPDYCAGSQMLILRVSGIRNRASMKHTAGTAIG